MDHPYLLIVHPDKASRALLRCMLEGLNYRIAEASGYRMGVGMLGRDPDALILAGADPGDPEASVFLATVYRQLPHAPLILLLSGEAPDLAHLALRYGASSVLRFPSPATQVRAAVIHALDRLGGVWGTAPCDRHRSVSKAVTNRPVEAAMVGEDPALRRAVELGRAIAPTRNPVLIVGEPGSGKSLLARILHELSPRRNGPFVEVSCKPREESSQDELLFGGWLEGQEVERPGKVAGAHGGTLVLDEVNSLTPALQLKLHMALNDGRIETARASQVVRVDVRLILTSRSTELADAMPGRLWHHVYEHQSSATLRLPPLRERGTDVVKLAEHFLERLGQQTGRGSLGLSPRSLAALVQHSWPGNVLELKTVLQEAAALCRGARIDELDLGLSAGVDLPASGPSGARKAAKHGAPGETRIPIQPLRESLAEPEKWLILRALQARDWNRQETADALVINRATLEKKMKKYGLFSGNGTVLHDCTEGVES